MKVAQAFFSAALAGIFLSLVFSAQAQSTRQGYATVVRIVGEARYSPGNSVWHPLTVGQTLGPGNVIQTAVDSKVDLVLGDRIADHIVPIPDRVALAPDGKVRDMISYRAVAEQNVIRMEGNTVMAVDKLTLSNSGVDTISDTELDLRQGTIFGSVKKLPAESQYLIKTPNGIAGIRGTIFIISADGSISVIAGSLVVSHVDTNGKVTTVVLGPHEQWNPSTGQVTQLTPQELAQAIRTATQLTTLVKGIISFANDETIVYVSPVHGYSPNPLPPP